MSRTPNKMSSDPGTLGAEHQEGKAPVMATFLHQSQVQYGEGQYVLAPNQMLPVWDIKHWSLFRMFTAVSTNAISYAGKLIGLDDKPVSVGTLEELYHKSVEAENRELAGQPAVPENQADAFMRGKLATTILGNVGGQRVVQPDQLPIGCLPMKGRQTWGGLPTWVQQPMSAWEWMAWVAIVDEERNVRCPDRLLQKPREIAFFIRSSGGQFGWNVETEAMEEFQRIPLPFSWQSAEELRLLPPADDVYQAAEEGADLALSASAAVRRLALKERWEGHIYVGCVDPKETPEKRHVSMEEYRADYQNWSALYEMPYIPSNPWAALDYGAVEKVRRLLNHPMPQFRAGLPTQHKFWVS